MNPDFLTTLKTHMEVRLLLSAVLCEPDTSVFAAENVGQRLVTAFAYLLPEADLPTLDLDDPRKMLIAHTKLFVGPDKIPAPPYGSVYLEKDGRVMGRSTADVEQFYASQGLKVAPDQSELSDHAVVELEFSGQMLLKAAAALEEGLLVEADKILQNHELFDSKLMRSWLPLFGRHMEEAGIHPFYTGVGNLLQLLPPVPANPASLGIAANEVNG